MASPTAAPALRAEQLTKHFGGTRAVEDLTLEVPAMGMAFLAAFDPDGIAIELTAPL